MGRWDGLYARLPVAGQHLAVTAYGLYWRRLRFGPGLRRGPCALPRAGALERRGLAGPGGERAQGASLARGRRGPLLPETLERARAKGAAAGLLAGAAAPVEGADPGGSRGISPATRCEAGVCCASTRAGRRARRSRASGRRRNSGLRWRSGRRARRAGPASPSGGVAGDVLGAHRRARSGEPGPVLPVQRGRAPGLFLARSISGRTRRPVTSRRCEGTASSG